MPQTTKIFMNRRSQAVRLPVEFRFSVRENHLVALKSENRVERIGSDRDGYWGVK